MKNRPHLLNAGEVFLLAGASALVLTAAARVILRRMPVRPVAGRIDELFGGV